MVRLRRKLTCSGRPRAWPCGPYVFGGCSAGSGGAGGCVLGVAGPSRPVPASACAAAVAGAGTVVCGAGPPTPLISEPGPAGR